MVVSQSSEFDDTFGNCGPVQMASDISPPISNFQRVELPAAEFELEMEASASALAAKILTSLKCVA